MSEQQPYTQGGENYLVASNRLPVAVIHDSDGLPVIGNNGLPLVKASVGGMASAMESSLGSLRGTNKSRWLGWPGNGNGEIGGLDEALMTASVDKPFDLIEIPLTPDEVKNYYNGYSNDVLWPIFHGFADLSNNANPDYWPTYKQVNRKFAEAIASKSGEKDFIWVQDYHLMLAAKELNALNDQHKIGFFLHIPFPSQLDFAKLPQAQGKELISGLLNYDLVGFHTPLDVSHFIDNVRALFPDAEIEYPNKTARRVSWKKSLEDGGSVEMTTLVDAFPIGIDAEELHKQGERPEIIEGARQIKDQYPEQVILFDASRADYTKGILDGMYALDTAFEIYPELVRNITFIQAVVPSRQGIPAYDNLWADIINTAATVNTKHRNETWEPIRLNTKGLDADGMQKHLKASYGFVKTIIDGFNLVAAEYAVLGPDDGALILGQKAGAATLLGNSAMIIDPTDHEGTAHMINRVATMPKAEREARMKQMRGTIYENNIHRWAKNYWDTMRTIRTGI